MFKSSEKATELREKPLENCTKSKRKQKTLERQPWNQSRLGLARSCLLQLSHRLAQLANGLLLLLCGKPLASRVGKECMCFGRLLQVFALFCRFLDVVAWLLQVFRYCWRLFGGRFLEFIFVAKIEFLKVVFGYQTPVFGIKKSKCFMVNTIGWPG